MSLTAWPVNTDLLALLPSGVSVTTGQADALIAAAVSEFEERTGYHPFLADSADSSRIFDAPDGRSGRTFLDLNAGIISVTTVLCDYYEETSTGTTLTQYTEFNVWPPDAPNRKKPYTRLTFGIYGNQMGSPGYLNFTIDYRNANRSAKVKVTGKWGYAAIIPGDVWTAVLHRATSQAAMGAGAILTGGLLDWKEKDITENYGKQAFGALIEGFNSEFDAVAKRYQRLM